MNWKLIFQLSVFGLIMAFATISLVAQRAEPGFWIVIFVFCAIVIEVSNSVTSSFKLTDAAAITSSPAP